MLNVSKKLTGKNPIPKKDRMTITPMEPMPFPTMSVDGTCVLNPFQHDFYHMGTFVGRNVAIMYERHDHDDQGYIIVINTLTGERLRINFPNIPPKKGA